jgi:hypothetical protein
MGKSNPEPLFLEVIKINKEPKIRINKQIIAILSFEKLNRRILDIRPLSKCININIKGITIRTINVVIEY